MTKFLGKEFYVDSSTSFIDKVDFDSSVNINEYVTSDVSVLGDVYANDFIVNEVEDTDRTIYIDASTGDDDNDGSSSAPFETLSRGIKDIKQKFGPGITITFDVSPGTYNLTPDDIYRLNKLTPQTEFTKSSIEIIGKIAEDSSALTITQDTGDDPTIYNVSDASLSDDELIGKFLKDPNESIPYFPIIQNSSDNIIASGNITPNDAIYKNTVNINYNDDTFTLHSDITFSKVNLDVSANNGVSIGFREFESCYININYDSPYFYSVNLSDNYGDARINYTIINLSRNLAISKGLPQIYLLGSSILGNSDGSVTISFQHNNLVTYGGVNIIRNLNSEGNGFLERFGSFKVSSPQSAYFKFMNCKSAFAYYAEPFIDGRNNTTFIIDNCDHLVKAETPIFVDQKKWINIENEVIGTPNISLVGDNRSKLLAPNEDYHYYIKEYDYGEVETHLSSSLTADSSTQLTIGHKEQNRSMIIDYNLQRGTNFEEGQLRLLNANDNLYMTRDYQNTGESLGVSFESQYDSSLIQLNCIVDDSSTTDVSINYDIYRKMI